MYFVIADPGGDVDAEELTRHMESPEKLLSMGAPSTFAAELNELAAAAEISTGAIDPDTGVRALDFVDHLSVHTHDGQVRWVLVNGGTGELVQVLVGMAAARHQVWRFIDGGTDEEWKP